MRPDPELAEVYLHRESVGFRKAIDGLAAIIEGEMQFDLFSTALFVFCNRRRNRLKMLFDYGPSRSGDVHLRLLKDYQGYLVSDGYKGYSRVAYSGPTWT